MSRNKRRTKKPLTRRKGGIFEPQPNWILMILEIIKDSMRPLDYPLNKEVKPKKTIGKVNTKGQKRKRRKK